MSKKTSAAILGVLAALVYAWLGGDVSQLTGATGPGPTSAPSELSAPAGGPDGSLLLAEAFRSRRSDLWLEGRAVVEKTLRDDDEPPRHQRFIARFATGQTVLFAHNIDVARRAPLEKGDSFEFRGEYEWNERGGVIHWTHADTSGRRGGWLRVAGQTYR